MTNYRQIEQHLLAELKMTRRPIAIAFRQDVPAGVPKFTGTVPSGCTFWRLASEGKTFYTVPSDHYNCPIGAYTHRIALPSDRASELEQTLGFMASLEYVRMEEVARIPVLPATPGVVVYAPLGNTLVDPDVVLFWGRASSVMLLQEAAMHAGIAANLNALGRPTCMALPAAVVHGMVASTGCVGNRVYAGVQDEELYAAVPGRDLARLADSVPAVQSANAKLMDYHEGRRQDLTSQPSA